MALRDGQRYANGTVTASVMGYTSSGKEQLAITFDLAPENEGDPAESVTKYVFFTEKALPMAYDVLEALGWNPEENDFQLHLLDGTDVLVGRTASLVLEQEEYPAGSQQWHTRVVFVNRARGGAVKERMAPEAAKAFSGTLREKMLKEAAKRRLASGEPAPAAPASRAAPARAPVRPPAPRQGAAPAPATASTPASAGGAGQAGGKLPLKPPARRGPAPVAAAAPAGGGGVDGVQNGGDLNLDDIPF